MNAQVERNSDEFDPDNIISKTIDRVTSDQKRIVDIAAKAKRLTERAKEDIYEVAAGAVLFLDPDSSRELMEHLYWVNKLSVSRLAAIMNMKELAFKNWIGLAEVFVNCRQCGEIIIFTAKSRNHLETVVDDSRAICESCQEKDRKHRAQESARQKEEYDRKIAELRAMPYAKYLKTQHWIDKRNSALRRAKYKCELCNRDNVALQVHHKTYERRGHEYSSDLIVLCSSCHARHHGKLEKEPQ
jgi:gas vesicle protein